MCQCIQHSQQDKWQEYIARGNTEFSLHYFGNAILMYTQALDDARSKFESTARNSHEQAISKVVICYFNLADCYIKLGQIDRACDFYTQTQSFLIRINEESRENPEDLSKAVSHADSHINLVWADFSKKYHDQITYERLQEYHTSSMILRNESASATYH